MPESEAIDPMAVPELVEGFLWEELDDGCVLYHAATGRMVTLNGSAEAVMTCCGGGGTAEEVLRRAEGHFGLSGDVCMAALLLLLKEGVIRLALPS
jgi:hypothetical protein